MKKDETKNNDTRQDNAEELTEQQLKQTSGGFVIPGYVFKDPTKNNQDNED